MDNTVKPLFSILIPTWNNLSFLKLCIEVSERTLVMSMKYSFISMMEVTEHVSG